MVDRSIKGRLIKDRAQRAQFEGIVRRDAERHGFRLWKDSQGRDRLGRGAGRVAETIPHTTARNLSNITLGDIFDHSLDEIMLLMEISELAECLDIVRRAPEWELGKAFDELARGFHAESDMGRILEALEREGWPELYWGGCSSLRSRLNLPRNYDGHPLRKQMWKKNRWLT